jgi:DNA-binding transcriptional ArsR family regulator
MELEPRIEENKTYPRPKWISADVSREEELCPTCFKAVGVESRYKLICALGKEEHGATVSELTEHLGLKQPTVTHHLQVLQSVDAVNVEDRGRERVYTLNRNAHCFEDCKIPY